MFTVSINWDTLCFNGYVPTVAHTLCIKTFYCTEGIIHHSSTLLHVSPYLRVNLRVKVQLVGYILKKLLLLYYVTYRMYSCVLVQYNR